MERVELREKIPITNTGELFWGSSRLLYVPAFTTMKDFTIIDPARSRNTYKFSQEILDPQVFHLFPQEQYTRTCKLNRGHNLQLLGLQR